MPGHDGKQVLKPGHGGRNFFHWQGRIFAGNLARWMVNHQLTSIRLRSNFCHGIETGLVSIFVPEFFFNPFVKANIYKHETRILDQR